MQDGYFQLRNWPVSDSRLIGLHHGDADLSMAGDWAPASPEWGTYFARQVFENAVPHGRSPWQLQIPNPPTLSIVPFQFDSMYLTGSLLEEIPSVQQKNLFSILMFGIYGYAHGPFSSKTQVLSLVYLSTALAKVCSRGALCRANFDEFWVTLVHINWEVIRSMWYEDWAKS